MSAQRYFNGRFSGPNKNVGSKDVSVMGDFTIFDFIGAKKCVSSTLLGISFHIFAFKNKFKQVQFSTGTTTTLPYASYYLAQYPLFVLVLKHG